MLYQALRNQQLPALECEHHHAEGHGSLLQHLIIVMYNLQYKSWNYSEVKVCTLRLILGISALGLDWAGRANTLCFKGF